MRLILIGQAAFAENVLVGLLGDGHEIAAVYCPPDKGPKPDPVKVQAEARGIPVRQHRSLRGSDVVSEFEALGADLAVLAYVTQIVPQAVFETPRLGSICFHPSLLPRYRGGSAIPWQIIKGETTAGVSVFWVDPGIDTGPIILQKSAIVDADDTAASLYFNKLFPIGVDAVIEAVRLVSSGAAPRLPQDESRATYDPLCSDEHARIDWFRPVQEIYNLIRGCDPQPGAYTLIGQEKLRLFESRPVNGLAHQPGMVLEISPEGILISASTGAIRAKRAKLGLGPKVAAAEAAGSCGLSVGMKLN